MQKNRKGQVEDEISRAIIKFEREHMGRGPKEVKTCIMGDIIFIRLKGVLTPAEQQLAKNEGGIELIKKVRANLIENSKSFLEQIISKITKNELISMHTDISTVTGERVILFILPENFEEKFK